jgi:glyoxylase I family protein
VESIEESVVELKKHGIVPEKVRVDPYTQKRFVFFEDPDGLPLELYEN